MDARLTGISTVKLLIQKYTIQLNIKYTIVIKIVLKKIWETIR